MGCKCSDNVTDKEIKIFSPSLKLLQQEERNLSAVNLNNLHTEIKIKHSSNVGFELIQYDHLTLQKKLTKKNTNPDITSLSSTLVNQKSIMSRQYESNKLVITTDIFKRENKKSIYYFYDFLHVVGRGNLLSRHFR